MGRTGTFITLDEMMERLKERDDLNIFEFDQEETDGAENSEYIII